MEDERCNLDIAFEDTYYKGRYLGDADPTKALTDKVHLRSITLSDREIPADLDHICEMLH